MRTKRMVRCLVLLASLVALIASVPASALADDPDVIGQYSVHVTPRDDGTLTMDYRFSGYCATTDFPSDKAYLQVGVPNRNYVLTDWGPKSAPNSQTRIWVTSTELIQAAESQVQLNFNRQPVAGDCWDLNFTVVQSRMAYGQGTDEVGFQFTPGWFDFAKINKLTIAWDLPGDPSLVHKLDPAPTKSPTQAVWTETNLAPNDKFTVTLTYAKSAFPNLTAPVASPPSPPSSSGSQDNSTFLCVIVILIIVLVLVVRTLRFWGSDGGYGGGLGRGYSGGFGGGFLGSDGGVGRSSSRSGGGGGGFAGRGSSCACASCACACACAGGGRAGCTRKGFDISFMMRKRKALPL